MESKLTEYFRLCLLDCPRLVKCYVKNMFFVVGFLFVVIVYCCLFFVVQDLEGFFFLEYTVHLLDLANVCIGVLATMLSDSMLNRVRLLVRYKVVFNRIHKILSRIYRDSS